MAATKGIIDWKVMAKYEDLTEIIDILPPQVVVDRLGARKIIETLGLARVIQEVGFDRVFDAMKAVAPPDQWRERIAREAEGQGGA